MAILFLADGRELAAANRATSWFHSAGLSRTMSSVSPILTPSASIAGQASHSGNALIVILSVVFLLLAVAPYKDQMGLHSLEGQEIGRTGDYTQRKERPKFFRAGTQARARVCGFIAGEKYLPWQRVI
jgi:hypothetical protein